MAAEGDLFGSAGSGARAGGRVGSAAGNAGPDGPSDPVDGAPERRLPLVLARSGRSVEFDGARLAASIERARRAAGHDDPGLAAEVADIVAFSLASRTGEALEQGILRPLQVSVDEIGWLVERVLVELGHARAAKEYILARDRKARTREARAGAHVDTAAGVSRRLPAVLGATGTEPFDERRIAAALIEEASLELAQAERVADRVAETLAGTSLRRVSTGLVRELISNELLGLGLQDALKRHEAVGVPRHDLTRYFATALAPRVDSRPEPGTRAERARAPRFEDLATAALLRRWALDDVLPAECAEAHRAADLHIVGAGALHRSLARSTPAELLRNGARWTRSTAFDLVRQTGRAAADVAHSVVLEDVAGAVSALVTSRSGARDQREAAVVDFVLALGAVAATSRRDVGLARFGGRDGVACGRLLRATRAAVEEVGVSLRLFATVAEIEEALALDESDGAPDPETADAVEVLLESGHLVPVWAPAGTTWAGPGCVRGRRERGGLATGAAIAINLPRLARRAGPWREDVFLGALLERVANSIDALDALGRLQDAARSAQGVFVAERVVHGIVPVGLVDALRILGDGIARAEQGARVLGVLQDAATRLGAARGRTVRVTSAFGDTAARRFAEADARLGRHGQPRLFADLPRPEDDLVDAYRAGLGSFDGATPSTPARAEALGALLSTLPAGALLPRQTGASREFGGDVAGPAVSDSDVGASGAVEGRKGPDRPRFAVWRHFVASRGADVEAGPGEGEKTLF